MNTFIKSLIFSVLIPFFLWGCERHQQSQTLSEIEPVPTLTPLPWVETSRLPNPTGEIDAVLVTRPDSGPPRYLTGDPTEIHLVPRGDIVANESPFAVDRIQEHVRKTKALTPFIAYDVQEMSLAWAGPWALHVEAKSARSIKKEVIRFQVALRNGGHRWVNLEYHIAKREL